MSENSRRTTNANARAKKPNSKSKTIFFAVEVFLILIMLAALYLVLSNKNEGPKMVELNPEDLGISDQVLANSAQQSNPNATTGEVQKKGYMNVALFGVDAKKESQLFKGSNSDTIMIASINMENGDIKLVSVYRDTYLNVGTDEYRKSNYAYAQGGAPQAIKMLNMNLDMDITNFIAVNYQSLIDLVDGLGGIYMDVNENELRDINNYQITIVNDIGLSGYTPVKETGYQLLNGLQVTAFCRIRKTLPGGDFDRAANQREVIRAIEKKAKETDVATLTKVFGKVVEEIYTSLDSKDLLTLVTNINNYRIVDEGGFPEETMRTTGNIGATGSCVIPLDLESNVVWLHQFLFEDESYTVSSTVKECGSNIKTKTSPYLNR